MVLRGVFLRHFREFAPKWAKNRGFYLHFAPKQGNLG